MNAEKYQRFLSQKSSRNDQNIGQRVKPSHMLAPIIHMFAVLSFSLDISHMKAWTTLIHPPQSQQMNLDIMKVFMS